MAQALAFLARSTDQFTSGRSSSHKTGSPFSRVACSMSGQYSAGNWRSVLNHAHTARRSPYPSTEDMAAWPPRTAAALWSAAFSGEIFVDMTHSLRHVDAFRQRLVDPRPSARLLWAMAHPEDERKALGAHLATARADAGYSLQGAATALTDGGNEVGKAAIGAWETGRNVPDALWLLRLARLYKCTVDELIGAPESVGWPFKRVPLSKILSLEPDDLSYVEGALANALGDVSPMPIGEAEEVVRRQVQASQGAVKPVTKRRSA